MITGSSAASGWTASHFFFSLGLFLKTAGLGTPGTASAEPLYKGWEPDRACGEEASYFADAAAVRDRSIRRVFSGRAVEPNGLRQCANTAVGVQRHRTDVL